MDIDEVEPSMMLDDICKKNNKRKNNKNENDDGESKVPKSGDATEEVIPDSDEEDLGFSFDYYSAEEVFEMRKNEFDKKFSMSLEAAYISATKEPSVESQLRESKACLEEVYQSALRKYGQKECPESAEVILSRIEKFMLKYPLLFARQIKEMGFGQDRP